MEIKIKGKDLDEDFILRVMKRLPISVKYLLGYLPKRWFFFVPLPKKLKPKTTFIFEDCKAGVYDVHLLSLSVDKVLGSTCTYTIFLKTIIFNYESADKHIFPRT